MVLVRARVLSPRLQGCDHLRYKEPALAYADLRELWTVTDGEKREALTKERNMRNVRVFISPEEEPHRWPWQFQAP